MSGHRTKMSFRFGLVMQFYVAFQNLNEADFEYAPAASIVASSDHDATWTKPSSSPMFGTANNTDESVPALFTTIMFLDYGRNYANAPDNYVYVYGFDNNWRDEQQVYLARVPSRAVLVRQAWDFFTGIRGERPTWSHDITEKMPVFNRQLECYHANNHSPASHPIRLDRLDTE
jgi:hypothetical protein